MYIIGEKYIHTEVRTEEHTRGHHKNCGIYARREIHRVIHTHEAIYRKRGYIRERTNIRENVGLFRNGTIGGDEGQPREMYRRKNQQLISGTV